jgi:hypothetical protein
MMSILFVSTAIGMVAGCVAGEGFNNNIKHPLTSWAQSGLPMLTVRELHLLATHPPS